MDVNEEDSAYTSYQKGRELMETGDLVGAIDALETSAQKALHFKTLELLGECYLRL